MRRTIVLSGLVSFTMAFLGTLAALAVAWPGVVGAQEARIRAEQFTVVGANGADRINLRTTPGVGAYVDVYDADGRRRAVVGTGGVNGDAPDNAGIDLAPVGGKGGARMGHGNPDEGLVALHLSDQNGRDRILLRISEDGVPAIQMLDANGAVSWSAR